MGQFSAGHTIKWGKSLELGRVGDNKSKWLLVAFHSVLNGLKLFPIFSLFCLAKIKQRQMKPKRNTLFVLKVTHK